MNNRAFTDKELRAAGQQWALAWAKALPSPEECTHVFSDSFNSRMKPLFARAVRRDRFKNTLKGAAALFILAFMTLTLWLSFDAEARGALFEWVREVWEKGIVYRFDDTADMPQKLPEYEITLLPEGFEETDVIKTDTVFSGIYENRETGKGFVFDYRVIVDKTESYIIFERETESWPVTINGLKGEYFFDGDVNSLIWFDPDGGIEFEMNGNLSIEEMIKIAESVVIHAE